MSNHHPREQFGSRLGFILASAGSAVGLGNIWRFPYVTGENGGAAFLFIYIFMVFFLGFSVMLSEFVIGRGTQKSSVGALRELGGTKWSLLGWMGIIASIIILSFYGVVGGWTIKYFVTAFTGLPSGTDAAAQAGKAFQLFTQNTFSVVFYQAIFMLITIFIVSKGISEGIEKFSKILMPALFIIMIILAIRSLTLNGAMEGVIFYLKPDFSKINGNVILAAMAQAFFSLSIGIGVMLTYGSYLNKKEPLPSSAFQVCILDTLVAFISGLIIFPAVFAFGFQPTAGPGLTFITLPVIFSQIYAGPIWAGLFFLILIIASITSSISLLGIISAHFIDEKKWSKTFSSWVIGIGTFILGIPSAVSLSGNLNIFGKSFMDCMDFTVTNIMMPIGGILIVCFTGWVMTKKAKKKETKQSSGHFKLLPAWDIICKVIAPIAISIIFIKGLKW